LTNNNKLPSEKNFGIFFSLVFVLLGIYLSFNRIFLFDLLSYILSFFLLNISIDNPNSLARLNILWGQLGNFLGRIVSPLVMLMIYISIFVPVSLLLRIINRDELRLKINNSSNSYWKEIRQDNENDFFYNQF